MITAGTFRPEVRRYPRHRFLPHSPAAHLGDFDQAISAEEASTAASIPLTPEGITAPEVLSPATPDHRADRYSLGAVLYELLVGVLPSAGEHPTQVVPPSRFRQDVPPPRLDTLIVSNAGR